MHQSYGLVHSLETLGNEIPGEYPNCPGISTVSLMLLSSHHGVASSKAWQCAYNCASTKEKLPTYAASISIPTGENKREKQKSVEQSFILSYANRDANQKLQHSRPGKVTKYDSKQRPPIGLNIYEKRRSVFLLSPSIAFLTLSYDVLVHVMRTVALLVIFYDFPEHLQ